MVGATATVAHLCFGAHRDEIMKDRQRWTSAPYFIVDDVVSTANYYRDKLGFHYERFWNDPPSFCMVKRNGVVIMLAQLETPGAMRPNHLVDPEGMGHLHLDRRC